MRELELDALRENLPKVLSFIDEDLEAAECPMMTQTAIEIAVEEIYINIASYAYGDKTGKALIQVAMTDEPLSIEITFIDSGTKYNPLEKEDPDLNLPLMERKKGGLGIFMVKESMDDVLYEYKDGKNMLTICKNLV